MLGFGEIEFDHEVPGVGGFFADQVKGLDFGFTRAATAAFLTVNGPPNRSTTAHDEGPLDGLTFVHDHGAMFFSFM